MQTCVLLFFAQAEYEGAAFIEENNCPPGSSFTYAQAAAIMARMDKQKDDEFLPFVYIKAIPPPLVSVLYAGVFTGQ